MMHMTRKRESDGILDSWDVLTPRKCTHYLILLCWTAQKKPLKVKAKTKVGLT